MEINNQTFAAHAAELRTRLLRAVSEIGSVSIALADAEHGLAMPNYGEPYADLAILERYAQDLVAAHEAATEHLASAGEKVSQLQAAIAGALRKTEGDLSEDAPDNGVSYRLREAKEGGAS